MLALTTLIPSHYTKNAQQTADMAKSTEEILNEKLYFFFAVTPSCSRINDGHVQIKCMECQYEILTVVFLCEINLVASSN